MIYPWFKDAWQVVTGYKRHNRVPSGLLLYGAPGIGKLNFAQRLAQFLLCQNSGTEPCGRCRSCHLYIAASHPDYFQVYREEGSNQIKIDQIRDLVLALGQTAGLSQTQVAIISKAEAMNRAAANALLKTLEEPQGQVTIILVSDRLNAVPPTIRSRCQKISLNTASQAMIEPWLADQIDSTENASIYLKMTDGLPLKALSYAQADRRLLRDSLLSSLQRIKKETEDPSQVAAKCLEDPLLHLELLLTLVMDLVRIKLSSKDYLTHHDKMTVLEEIAQDLDIKDLFQVLTSLLEAIQAVSLNSNVNLQLLFEKILITWRYNNGIS